MTRETQRLRQTATAYEEHALSCPTCSDLEDSLLLCETGMALMQDFYDALQHAARSDRGVDKEN